MNRTRKTIASSHLTRILRACLVVAVVSTMAFVGVAARAARPASATTGWLDTINYYRAAAGVGPVTENAAWSEGIAEHLTYLRLTPAEYLTGEYASAHTENPASPYYTAAGAAEAAASDLEWGTPTTEAAVMDEWLASPFHAIGMLRKGLTQVAFYMDSYGYAGLDVISGLDTSVTTTTPVLFPGPGATTDLSSYSGSELPSPLETCGWTAPAGLPLIALLPSAPPVGTTATLVDSHGTPQQVCVVDEHTYTSSDPVYGPTGLQILQYDQAVFVIPRNPLAVGQYTATISQPSHSDIGWSFDVATPPGAPTGVTGVRGNGQVQVSWSPPASDGGSAVTAYTVTSSPGGQSCSTSGALSCRVTGLTNGTAYTFTVTAANVIGSGPASAPSAAVTPATVPGAPVSPTATAGNQSATVSWSAPLSDGGAAVTGYAVTSSPGSKTCTTTGARSCVVAGLTNGTPYTFTVTASNVVGTGAASASTTPVTPAVPPGDSFHALSPVRVLDSRPGAGNTGGYATPWGAGVTRDVTVGGLGGVPSNATAVVLNVTVTGTTGSSFLSIWPAGASRPTVSSLNWTADETIPNQVTVKVGTSGQVSIYNASGSADVIVDVTGYYDTNTGDGFSSLDPTRVLDSRPGTGNTGGYTTPWGAGTSRDLQVGGVGGVPADADAVVLNVTVTGTTSSSFLSIWPAGASRPTVSSLNWTAGETIPNAVTVELGSSGKVSLYNLTGDADVVVDVAGYFEAGTGKMFHPLTPGRILDSRPGAGNVGGYTTPWGPTVTRNVAVAGSGGVLTGADSVVANVTATDTTSSSFLSIWPAGASRPTVSSLNWSAGETIPNAVTVKLSAGGALSFYNAAGNVDAICDVAGYYA